MASLHVGRVWLPGFSCIRTRGCACGDLIRGALFLLDLLLDASLLASLANRGIPCSWLHLSLAVWSSGRCVFVSATRVMVGFDENAARESAWGGLDCFPGRSSACLLCPLARALVGRMIPSRGSLWSVLPTQCARVDAWGMLGHWRAELSLTCALVVCDCEHGRPCGMPMCCSEYLVHRVSEVVAHGPGPVFLTGWWGLVYVTLSGVDRCFSASVDPVIPEVEGARHLPV